VSLDRLVVETEIASRRRVVDESAGACGQHPQELSKLRAVQPDLPDLRKVATEHGLRVGAKISDPLASGQREHARESAGDNELGIGRTALLGAGDLGRCSVEERVDDRRRVRGDLRLGERPQATYCTRPGSASAMTRDVRRSAEPVSRN
jgi:hypothetical protein